MKLIKSNQKGLASIVVVMVLVALLSLISIAFARLMDRAVNGSLNNQLSTSAAYAAQSGINDTIAFVQANPTCATTAPPTCSSTNCTTIFGTPPNGIRQNFVDPSDSTYKYSCILVNPTPPVLTYSQLPASQSQVTEVNAVDSGGNPATIGSFLFSWQADGGDVAKTNTSGTGCAATNLYDENTWSSKDCPPLLRVTLYPVSGTSISQGHTYFLYPTNTGGNSFAYTTADGTIEPVNCNNKTISTFNGSLDEQCNVVVSGLPAADYYYLRLTPLYDQATVKVKANDAAGQALLFKGDQALIDVTADAGTAAKRLQAAVKINNSTDITPGEAALPEDGLRSADAICKQLDDNGTTVTNKGPIVCQNQLTIDQPPPPPALPPTVKAISVSYSTVSTDTVTFNGTVNPNGGDITSCYFSYNQNPEFEGTGGTVPCSPSVFGGTATQPVTGTIQLDCNNYYWKITASNAAGSSTDPTGTPLGFNIITDDPDNDCSGGPGPDIPYLTSFTQPPDATCNARYGAVHVNNCYDWTGGNLPGCVINIVKYLDGTPGGSGSVGGGVNGGSATLGNGPGTPGVTYIQCGSAMMYLGGTAPPPPPGGSSGPVWISFGVTYYGYIGTKSLNNGVLRPPWCNDNVHSILVCFVFVTKGEQAIGGGCTVSWTNPGQPYFLEEQFSGDTADTGFGGNGGILGWPYANGLPGQGPLTVNCTDLPTKVWTSPNSAPGYPQNWLVNT